MVTVFTQTLGYANMPGDFRFSGKTLAEAVEANFLALVKGRIGDAGGWNLRSVTIEPKDLFVSLKSYETRACNYTSSSQGIPIGSTHRQWLVKVAASGACITGSRNTPAEIELLVPIDYPPATETIEVR